MSISSYDSLVSQYQKAVQDLFKARWRANLALTVIWSLLFIMKGAQTPHLNYLSLIGFGSFLIYRAVTFKLRRGFDKDMVRTIVEGLKIEKRSRLTENYFQNELKQFEIIRSLLVRAIPDIAGVFFLLSAIYKYLNNKNIPIEEFFSKKALYIGLGIFGYWLSDLYYKSLKPLIAAKKATSLGLS